MFYEIVANNFASKRKATVLLVNINPRRVIETAERQKINEFFLPNLGYSTTIPEMTVAGTSIAARR